MVEAKTVKDINEVLQQYHQKFDDSKVRKLLEDLESEMYSRADFFRDFISNNPELEDELDEYWSEFDSLGYGSDEHNEILDKVRDNVKGLKTCWVCTKIGVLKPKLMTSMLTDNAYIVKLCENCITKKNWVVKYKEKIEMDTEIPQGFTDQEKEFMTEYQKRLKTIKGQVT